MVESSYRTGVHINLPDHGVETREGIIVIVGLKREGFPFGKEGHQLPEQAPELDVNIKGRHLGGTAIHVFERPQRVISANLASFSVSSDMFTRFTPMFARS